MDWPKITILGYWIKDAYIQYICIIAYCTYNMYTYRVSNYALFPMCDIRYKVSRDNTWRGASKDDTVVRDETINLFEDFRFQLSILWYTFLQIDTRNTCETGDCMWQEMLQSLLNMSKHVSRVLISDPYSIDYVQAHVYTIWWNSPRMYVDLRVLNALAKEPGGHRGMLYPTKMTEYPQVPPEISVLISCVYMYTSHHKST